MIDRDRECWSMHFRETVLLKEHRPKAHDAKIDSLVLLGRSDDTNAYTAGACARQCRRAKMEQNFRSENYRTKT